MRRESGISKIPVVLLASVVLMARGRREITWRPEIVQDYRRHWLTVLGPLRASMRFYGWKIFPQVYSNLPIPSIEQFSDWFLSWILVILGCFFVLFFWCGGIASCNKSGSLGMSGRVRSDLTCSEPIDSSYN
jgi:hypothetical protein